MRWGVQAVVAESYAEIFFGNCTALGIPAVTLDRAKLEELVAAIDLDPTVEVTIDLEADQVRWGPESASAELPESARTALVSGEWDFLSQLLANGESIRETASKIPYLNGFAAE
jgi:3-isopropylmalate/(R)-2-methylmalate dehydratase small subunit